MKLPALLRLLRQARTVLPVFVVLGFAAPAKAQLLFNSGDVGSLAGYQQFKYGSPYFGAFEDSGNQWFKNIWYAGRFFQPTNSGTIGDVFLPLMSTQSDVRLQIAKVNGTLGDWAAYDWLGSVVTAPTAHTSWVEFDFSLQNIQLDAGETYVAILGVTQTGNIWTSRLNYWLGVAGVEPNIIFATHSPGFDTVVTALSASNLPGYYALAASNYIPGLYVEAKPSVIAPPVLTPVPEPSTYGLIAAAALLGIVGLRHRRRSVPSGH